jgi:GMP synthase (glutamine-hydrolysing)
MIRAARAKGMVVETNWDWHKDEVRQVARKLGIDERIASRQPFPGPGLAIRLVCHENHAEAELQLREQVADVMADLKTTYKAEALPIKTVGVQGDNRTYRYLSLLWGRGMEFDCETIYRIGHSLPNRVSAVNRVAYILNRADIKSPVSCHRLYISRENMELLRKLDHIVTQSLNRPPVSQVLAVLVPIGVDKKLSVAIRAFVTNDYMTGRPAFIGEDVEKDVISELVAKIEKSFPEIDLILYDITSKPPATVEWQ